jgi:hypothetical protein
MWNLINVFSIDKFFFKKLSVFQLFFKKFNGFIKIKVHNVRNGITPRMGLLSCIS